MLLGQSCQILGIRYLRYNYNFDPQLEFTQLSGPLLSYSYGPYQSYIFSSLCVSNCPNDGVINLLMDTYTCYHCQGVKVARNSPKFGLCAMTISTTAATAKVRALVGCLDVIQVSIDGSLKHQCIKCNETEFYMDSLMTCQCKTGFLAGQHCTSQ